MRTAAEHDLEQIGAAFLLEGEFVSSEPYGSGHIHDTFVALYQRRGQALRYLHQRINSHVFPHPEVVMENIVRVTGHIRGKLKAAGADQIGRRVLEPLRAAAGGFLHYDGEGGCWRTYRFIEGAHSHDRLQDPTQAFQVAKAFGEFQQLLRDLPLSCLAETIPAFHDTPARLQALERAAKTDPCRRAAEAAAEIDFVARESHIAGRLQELERDGRLPRRVTHNDTKVNNVLLDDRSGEGLCVIDLDTVMPGLALYDFGDMIRTAASTVGEDERDLSRVGVRMPVVEALARGYLAATAPLLQPAELKHLAFSGRLITLEIGVRFLTDHLEGDRYFRTRHPGHNLERARAQFQLYRELRRRQDEIEGLIERVLEEETHA